MGEAEFKVLKEGLDLQKTALDRARDDRLVSIRDYYGRQTHTEQQAIDQEMAAKQQELTAQSAIADGGKDEAQRLRAKAEVKKLEGEITVLNRKRGEVEPMRTRPPRPRRNWPTNSPACATGWLKFAALPVATSPGHALNANTSRSSRNCSAWGTPPARPMSVA